MGATLLQAVAALVGRLQGAARRMAADAGGCGGGKGSPPRAVVAPWKKLAPTGKAAREAEAAEAGVWRKEILMGERCQPLDFSGVIYYDTEDRRLTHPPPPRSPMRSSLPASPRVNLLSIKSGAVDLKSVDDMSSSIQWGPGASGCKVGDGYNDCWFAVDEVGEP